jgi:hypothetical protein
MDMVGHNDITGGFTVPATVFAIEIFRLKKACGETPTINAPVKINPQFEV